MSVEVVQELRKKNLLTFQKFSIKDLAFFNNFFLLTIHPLQTSSLKEHDIFDLLPAFAISVIIDATASYWNDIAQIIGLKFHIYNISIWRKIFNFKYRTIDLMEWKKYHFGNFQTHKNRMCAKFLFLINYKVIFNGNKVENKYAIRGITFFLHFEVIQKHVIWNVICAIRNLNYLLNVFKIIIIYS